MSPPFNLRPRAVTYSGNDGTNTVPVGNNQTVQTNVPGDQIFTANSGNVMQSLT